jgi:hypothetical protein
MHLYLYGDDKDDEEEEDNDWVDDSGDGKFNACRWG